MRGEEARVRDAFCGGEGEEDGEGGGAERVGGALAVLGAVGGLGVRWKGVRGCGECAHGCGCVVLAAGAGGFATPPRALLIDVFEISVTALPKLDPRPRSRVRSEGALRR